MIVGLTKHRADHLGHVSGMSHEGLRGSGLGTPLGGFLTAIGRDMRRTLRSDTRTCTSMAAQGSRSLDLRCDLIIVDADVSAPLMNNGSEKLRPHVLAPILAEDLLEQVMQSEAELTAGSSPSSAIFVTIHIYLIQDSDNRTHLARKYEVARQLDVVSKSLLRAPRH